MSHLAEPKAGETVVVSAAAGAGSLAGRSRSSKGCRVVGIAGRPEKNHCVVGELGFDACVDHRDPKFAEALAAACAKGIDINFGNVGGQVLKTTWPLAS